MDQLEALFFFLFFPLNVSLCYVLLVSDANKPLAFLCRSSVIAPTPSTSTRSDEWQQKSFGKQWESSSSEAQEREKMGLEMTRCERNWRRRENEVGGRGKAKSMLPAALLDSWIGCTRPMQGLCSSLQLLDRWEYIQLVWHRHTRVEAGSAVASRGRRCSRKRARPLELDAVLCNVRSQLSPHYRKTDICRVSGYLPSV